MSEYSLAGDSPAVTLAIGDGANDVAMIQKVCLILVVY